MQPGWHEMTIADLRKLCVDSFPSSTTRVYIVTGLEFVVGKLISSKLSVDIWVNGSFLTSKINPEDSDIVLRIQVDVYNGWTEEQRSVIDWMANDDLKTPYHCHSFVFYEYPESHPLWAIGEYDRAYWTRQFGFSRGNNYKGIAVIKI